MAGEDVLVQLARLGYPGLRKGQRPVLSELETLEFDDMQDRSLRLVSMLKAVVDCMGESVGDVL